MVGRVQAAGIRQPSGHAAGQEFPIPKALTLLSSRHWRMPCATDRRKIQNRHRKISSPILHHHTLTLIPFLQSYDRMAHTVVADHTRRELPLRKAEAYGKNKLPMEQRPNSNPQEFYYNEEHDPPKDAEDRAECENRIRIFLHHQVSGVKAIVLSKGIELNHRLRQYNGEPKRTALL